MRLFPLLLLLIACQTATYAQRSNDVFEKYDQYKEQTITHQRFQHKDIKPLIEERRSNNLYKVSDLGFSIEGRSIHELQLGNGETKVLLWSQMHGNEPTATMAIFDLFNFFEQDDEFNDLRRLILDNLSLHFIPMLNPDGAEDFRRQNAIGIDLNRDALRLQSPESRILKTAQQSLQPAWGFNLHDQSRYYAVGQTDKPASISFLAPAYDFEKNVNEKRADAMQMIALMTETIEQYIPGQVAKYSDDFEPRAFGDNIQKWGTRTILIEAGAQYNDPEKQYLRKLHFVALLSAFEAIATDRFEQYDTKTYDAIPFNNRSLYDLIINNLTVEYEGEDYLLDIAFNRAERGRAANLHYDGQLSYIGDLSTSYAFEELDGTGYELEWGKTHPKVFNTVSEVAKNGFESFYKDGYSHVKVQKLPSPAQLEDYPIHFIKEEQSARNRFALWTNPTFFLVKDGKRDFLVRNGRAYKLEN